MSFECHSDTREKKRNKEHSDDVLMENDVFENITLRMR